MDKENLKNQALLEEFRQSWEHIRHVENQRWKIFMIFGTLCGVYVSGMSIVKTLRGGQIPFSVILTSSLFFQLFASIILLILLKWRYEFCNYMEDIQRKRKRFEFTQTESVFVGKPVPRIFKLDSVHWAIILFFWLVVIIAVMGPIALLCGSKAALYFFPEVMCYILAGCGIGIGFFGASFKTRKKIGKFFEKHEKKIPILFCMVILSLIVLVPLLYIYSGNLIIFIILLQFIILLTLPGIFVYFWLTYIEDLEEKRKKAGGIVDEK